MRVYCRHGPRPPPQRRPDRLRFRRRDRRRHAGARRPEQDPDPQPPSLRAAERQRARARRGDGALGGLAPAARAATSRVRRRAARGPARPLRPARRPCRRAARAGDLACRARPARPGRPRRRGAAGGARVTGHAAEHAHHGHSHGLVDASIKRSREGVRVVLVSLGVLGVTALAQAAIYVATGSVALLADLIHNVGDALTAIPLGAAFLLRSERAERGAGLAVVLAILASAITAAVFAIERIVNPLAPDHLLALALAGVVGVAGNAVAARVRLDGGRRLDSAALTADGQHARSDALVSVGVILSAVAVALGAPIFDPIVGLAITAMILHITWDSWNTVRGRGHHH